MGRFLPREERDNGICPVCGAIAARSLTGRIGLHPRARESRWCSSVGEKALDRIPSVLELSRHEVGVR